MTIWIGNPSQDAITARDKLHRHAMALASEDLLRAIEKAREGRATQASARLLWNNHTYVGGLASPGSQNSLLAPHRVLALLEEKERIRSLTVKRDPCPRCGTRMDIGCKHSRVA